MQNIRVFNAGAAVRPGDTRALLPAHDPEAVFSIRALSAGDLLVHDTILRHLRGPVVAA